MEARAVYAFSGDPITYGHIDIIKRAVTSFGSVLVAIGDNPAKKYLFSRSERVALAREVFRDFPGVEVTSFEGMLTDLAYERRIPIIVRGIRNANDFDYESLLFQLGKTQKRGIDFHFLLASPELVHVSSGATKMLQQEQGDIIGYVPLHVKAELERRISGQVFVGVTGEIAAGKSFISTELARLMKARGVECHHVDLDLVAYEILEEREEAVYREARMKLAEAFGSEILTVHGFVDRKELGKRIFGSPESLAHVTRIMKEPLLLNLRRTIQGKRGVILLNFALLAEVDWLSLCNNRVVLVESEVELRRKRLTERGWAPEQIKQRMGAQMSTEAKRARIQEAIARSGHGTIWEFPNIENDHEGPLAALVERLVGELALEVSAHEKRS